MGRKKGFKIELKLFLFDWIAYRIMEIFQSELWKSQLDQTILWLFRENAKLFVLIFVLHQILEIRIGKCTEKTIAIWPSFTNRLVLRCQIFQFWQVDRIIYVFRIQNRQILEFTNKWRAITNLEWNWNRKKKWLKIWFVCIASVQINW